MELKDRKRSIDINKLTIEQVDELGAQIGAKATEICEEAAVKLNRILNIYGMNAKIAIAFEPLTPGSNEIILSEEEKIREVQE
jgi:hypothetical protein